MTKIELVAEGAAVPVEGWDFSWCRVSEVNCRSARPASLA